MYSGIGCSLRRTGRAGALTSRGSCRLLWLRSALSTKRSLAFGRFRIRSYSPAVNMGTFQSFLSCSDVFSSLFFEQGIFIRGGVAFSQHFQSGRLTYSHAIARAYELESKVAGYPRIVIDNNIVAMYQTAPDCRISRCRDCYAFENGVYFLDILTSSNWQQVYTCARDIHSQSSGSLMADDPAFGKHIRFERYLRMSRHAPQASSPFIGGIESI